MLVVSCRDPPEMVLVESVGGRLSGHSLLATIAGGCGAWETTGVTGVRDMAAEAVGIGVDASREGIRRGSCGGNKEWVPEEAIEGGSVERSFKNKGTAKARPFL